MATKFINPLLGSSFRRSDNGFGAVFDLFPVLSGIQTTGSRVDSTGQCGPTQQVVGNGQEQGNAGDLGHPTHGEALYSVLHSGLSIDTFCCRGSVSIDGLTFPSLHALPPDDHPDLVPGFGVAFWPPFPFLGGAYTRTPRASRVSISSRSTNPPSSKPQGAALSAGPPAPPSPIPPLDWCLD